MDNKTKTIMELIRENERLRTALYTMRAQFQARDAANPNQQPYISGRWNRRDGDIYGIVVQPPGVIDADSPPGNL